MIALTTAITESASIYYFVTFLLCTAFVLNAWRQHRLRNGLPLPPGPIGLPMVGSVFDVNPAHPWLSYEQWGKRYGAIVYANLLGKDFIIINSAKVAHDLLDRRSTIYSGRPYMPENKTFGADFNSGFLPYGDDWRHHRKLYNTAFNKKIAIKYQPSAIHKAHQLIENLLGTPKDCFLHCRTCSTAGIMGATYGYEVVSNHDPFVTKTEHFLELLLTALTPERAALLLAFPFLAYIPPWLPGGKYKQQAAECRVIAEEVLTKPFQYVVDNMAAGKAGESLVHDLLETPNGKMDEDAIKAVATTAFLGGAETTDAVLRVFLLAMVLHPEVQAKAQEEIDQVVNSGRLPDFDDRPNLPYTEAVYLETHRWRPVAPTAIPHMTTTSDVYEGMYIPKGAVVIPNTWAIEHDETQFDDPMAFIPERHLTSAGTLAEGTAHHFFGFGRRICPGRHIADQNVWAGIVTMLATVRLSKARDEFGKEIEVEPEFTSGLTSAPKPFACSITPRSSRVGNLIRTRHEDGY